MKERSELGVSFISLSIKTCPVIFSLVRLASSIVFLLNFINWFCFSSSPMFKPSNTHRNLWGLVWHTPE